jgi:hypothetical protein
MTGALLAKGGEAAKSGPIGLAIILILCIVCYFLFKSLSKHLKTVRENFPADPPADPPAEAGPPAEADLAAADHPVAEADQPAEPPPA